MNTTSITLTKNEALVLFEFLTRFSETERLEINNQAEERVLWDLQCTLEKELQNETGYGYEKHLEQARNQIRDK